MIERVLNPYYDSDYVHSCCECDDLCSKKGHKIQAIVLACLAVGYGIYALIKRLIYLLKKISPTKLIILNYFREFEILFYSLIKYLKKKYQQRDIFLILFLSFIGSIRRKMV